MFVSLVVFFLGFPLALVSWLLKLYHFIHLSSLAIYLIAFITLTSYVSFIQFSIFRSAHMNFIGHFLHVCRHLTRNWQSLMAFNLISFYCIFWSHFKKFFYWTQRLQSDSNQIEFTREHFYKKFRFTQSFMILIIIENVWRITFTIHHSP